MTEAGPAPFVVDFKRPNLVGRDHLLKPLHEKVQKGNVALTPAITAAITGQAGIGKTQLAALYVHTYRSAFPGGVFWINFADPVKNRVVRQIAESFAPALGLSSGLNDTESRNRDLAAQWLGMVRNRRDVLIIADNVERPELLTSLDGLPNSRLTALDCCLVITTRQRELSGCEDFQLHRLPPEPARELLLREAERDGAVLGEGESAAVTRVCNMLGGLPLTLRLAGTLAREEAVSFSALAGALAKEGVIELIDGVPCPLEDYKTNVDRALNQLIEESLESIPQHKAQWLDVLKAAACFPEGAIIRSDFLRCFVKLSPGRLGDSFSRSLHELYRLNLMEHPDEAHKIVRLHPLIHGHFQKQLNDRFYNTALDCANSSILSTDFLAELTSEQFIELGTELALLPAPFLSDAATGERTLLGALQQSIEREAFYLQRGFSPLVQLQYRAEYSGAPNLAERFAAASELMGICRFHLSWSAGRVPASAGWYFKDAFSNFIDLAQPRVLDGHQCRVVACAFNPDGRRGVSASMCGTLIFWDVGSGEELRCLNTCWGGPYTPASCSFSADGERALTGFKKEAILWDLERGQELRRLKGSWSSGPCALSPDGRQALTGFKKEAILWDLERDTELGRFQARLAPVRACAFADKKRAFTGSENEMILWDLESGEELRRLEGSWSKVTACALSPDGWRAITGHDLALTILWDLERGVELRRLEASWWEDGAVSCTFSANGRRALTSFTEEVILWDAEHATELARIALGGGLSSAALTADGRGLLCANYAGGIVHLEVIGP